MIDFPILYQKERNCGGMNFCFTSSLQTAQNWTYCVQNAAARLMDDLRAEGEQLNYTAEEAIDTGCEVVYYDWLKNPMLVREPNPEKCSLGVVRAKLAPTTPMLGAILAVAAIIQ